jgi:amino acid adenylation domain-containing protein
MGKHFKMLLSSIIKLPQQKIGELVMITEAEKKQLLVEFLNNGEDYPKDKTIVDLFEEQSNKTPDAIAVVFEEEHLTYKQLNERANQLGHYLRSRGVKEETRVPICIERSVEMFIGILGILKSGGAYVPIDPEYPSLRIRYMLEDAGSAILISSKKSRLKLQISEGTEVVELDGDWKTISTQLRDNLQTNIQPNHLAYVIYTSGSTGRPKGVMIEHKSIVHYLTNSKTSYINEKQNGSGSFIHLSYTFDASLTAMFMPLISGKSVILGSKHGLEVFEDSNLYKYAPYDFIKITPLHLELLQFTTENIGGDWLTKKLVIGGEALHFSQFSYLVERGIDVEIINEYGPTEATVGCSTYGFKTSGDNEGIINNIPIGKPIDNMQLYIVDESNSLLPVGVVGEMCIGGAGLARGYLNHPQLTAEKFIADPFSIESGARIYRTGDYGKWLADGNIEYMGRYDDQVKIRGYRIELGEIENILLQCKGVLQGVVVARENRGVKQLVAYIVKGEEFDNEVIIKYLKSKIPEYMVPAFWVSLESLPLTPNGKIDKKALPDFDAENMLRDNYVAPRTEVENQLAVIWRQLLGVERIGIYDNFFHLGGHSLLAMRVLSAIKKELKVDMSIKDLFQYTTINDLGEYIEMEFDFTREFDSTTLEEIKL